MKNSSYRVVVIEPSDIVQKGLRSIIEENPSFVVVGEFGDINHAEDKITALRTDIVIINPSVIDFSRRNSIKSLFPDVAIIALQYSHIDSDILKQFSSVIDIYDAHGKISNKLIEAIVSDNSPEENNNDTDLSEREKEILIAVAKGMMNKEIALLHNISIHTVISHRKNISRKTGIKSVSGFVVYALLNSLLEQSDLQ